MILERVQTRDVWRYSLVAVLIAVIVAAVAVYLPAPVDWRTAFRPAARAMLLTGDPYQVEGFFNPPWTVLPMIPLAFLPEQIGAALMFVAGLAGFAFAAHRLGASPIVLGAFILSPPVMHSLLNGNIDWLPLVGFVLPPQIGLFFILIKPQMGLAVALFWLVEAWREGGLREVIRVFGPVGAALALSLALYGLWPLRSSQEVGLWWNASLWPMSIPIGLALVAAAVRSRRIEYAMGAAPCLSPYVLLHAWSGALAAILKHRVEALAAIAGLWLLVAIRAFDTVLTSAP
ncbi:MAG TPA: hypothetical protein PKI52_16850 [Aggregatilineales bacterium]|nr:hypothetical protein [Aggregatilineales bacterium]